MRLLHLADLHLGKRVNGFDFLPDQRAVLEQVLALCAEHRVGAVALAGDLYDAPVPPAAAVPAGQNEDPDAPVWDETMDNLLACLEEKGLISGERLTLASDGLCSLAVSESGAEFYWWDLDALDKDSAEYAAYESLKTEGSIDLFNSGSLISPASNGPFALLTTGYTGDVDALTDAFMAFGQSETEAG